MHTHTHSTQHSTGFFYDFHDCCVLRTSNAKYWSCVAWKKVRRCQKFKNSLKFLSNKRAEAEKVVKSGRWSPVKEINCRHWLQQVSLMPSRLLSIIFALNNLHKTKQDESMAELKNYFRPNAQQSEINYVSIVVEWEGASTSSYSTIMHTQPSSAHYFPLLVFCTLNSHFN